jgi:hypothetical protein
VLLTGNSLVHRDLNPTNFIITPGRTWLADWGWAVRGPAWLTPALLVLTLIEGGWRPGDAEAAAARLPSWPTAPAKAVSVFAEANARMWDQTAPRDRRHWSHTFRAGMAHQWASYRRSRSAA